ncbi:hypothetical protein [Paractinoplanes lichenicola]|uniref:Uncharacterized protein n=1 Tax=Paractinoplanes lichenicola TaxID=2802976 RepID=A0ABS1VWC1_9ACTN|nr:hypothetical protein [Actinoplanes lichenicola]MBL7258785.1 hypothetical protein [Actinoplanes lichenicola]
MVRRIVARMLVVLMVGAAALAGTAQAAQAFSRTVFCEREGLVIDYIADNNDFLGSARFHWYAGYWTIDIYDANPIDGAVMSARVDEGAKGVREYYSFAELRGDIRKWRAVWNGYASRWYPENSCYPQD